MAEATWQSFQLEELIEKQRSSSRPYLEFLRVPTLSCGIYSLPAGSRDLQSPHDEDEVYYVVTGRGRVRIGGAVEEVGPVLAVERPCRSRANTLLSGRRSGWRPTGATSKR